MSLRSGAPILKAGITTVSIRLTSVIEWTIAVRPGAEVERARQLARDDGALGAGVDDELDTARARRC